MRADPGPHLFCGIDGYREVRLVLRPVIAHHEGKVELSCALGRDGHANQSTRLSGKKVNDLGGDFFCGDNEIALVFAVFVIHQDDHAAGTDVVEECGDITKHNRRCNRLLRPAQSRRQWPRHRQYTALRRLFSCRNGPGRTSGSQSVGSRLSRWDDLERKRRREY